MPSLHNVSLSPPAFVGADVVLEVQYVVVFTDDEFRAWRNQEVVFTEGIVIVANDATGFAWYTSGNPPEAEPQAVPLGTVLGNFPVRTLKFEDGPQQEHKVSYPFPRTAVDEDPAIIRGATYYVNGQQRYAVAGYPMDDEIYARVYIVATGLPIPTAYEKTNQRTLTDEKIWWKILM